MMRGLLFDCCLTYQRLDCVTVELPVDSLSGEVKVVALGVVAVSHVPPVGPQVGEEYGGEGGEEVLVVDDPELAVV